LMMIYRPAGLIPAARRKRELAVVKNGQEPEANSIKEANNGAS
jgi:hypothetical protein